MNKYQEALDELVNIKQNFVYHEGKMVQIKNLQNSKILQELVDKQANNEQEIQVLKAMIQNKNAVIKILNKRLKKEGD